ncbi:unnamed protein product [Clavelina lepadiformis]|uniref:Centromere protein X n=1 Tax=Clavelina lepadiformis TaxID=159417 RepID=A0ABP0GI28_CLALP
MLLQYTLQKMSDNDKASFKPSLVVQLFQKHFADPSSIKMSSKDAAGILSAELLRVFVAEAASRAAQQALNEDASVCEVEHIEKILPQLLLDF